jgi:hypothetical protein
MRLGVDSEKALPESLTGNRRSAPPRSLPSSKGQVGGAAVQKMAFLAFPLGVLVGVFWVEECFSGLDMVESPTSHASISYPCQKRINALNPF